MTDMRVNLPGYVPEKRGKRTLHRVRVIGDKKKRITIPVGPDDPSFGRYYDAARHGMPIEATPPERLQPGRRTLAAMVDGYLHHLKREAETEGKSPLTYKQRRNIFAHVMAMKDADGKRTMGEYHCDLPAQAMMHIQDQWGGRTGQADTSIKALRAAYNWAIRRGWLDHNPAAAVKFIHVSKGGATAWTPKDIKAFLKTHKPGTAAYTWIMLGLWTGARLSDMTWLGRDNETVQHGIRWLSYQPGKKGSAEVALPMSSQLIEATRASSIIGKAYILNANGAPFKNGPTLALRARKWTTEAGLTARSSHGLRKAMGALLAEAGASEHQIMSVMAHTKPTTSAIYTKSAQRARMASAAMESIKGLKMG